MYLSSFSTYTCTIKDTRKRKNVHMYIHIHTEKLCESLDANATYLSRSSGCNPSKSPLESAFLFLSSFLFRVFPVTLLSLSLFLVFLSASLVVTTVPYLSHNGPCSFRLCVALSDELEKIDSGERMKLKAKFKAGTWIKRRQETLIQRSGEARDEELRDSTNRQRLERGFDWAVTYTTAANWDTGERG